MPVARSVPVPLRRLVVESLDALKISDPDDVKTSRQTGHFTKSLYFYGRVTERRTESDLNRGTLVPGPGRQGLQRRGGAGSHFSQDK